MVVVAVETLLLSILYVVVRHASVLSRLDLSSASAGIVNADVSYLGCSWGMKNRVYFPRNTNLHLYCLAGARPLDYQQ